MLNMDGDSDFEVEYIFQVSKLSEKSDSEGFDNGAGQTWIYPTNYPVRDYQFNIIEKALYKNTLVSLPTGLGKTFIAAVIMYNFYRWYPNGKVIFIAPTKPLVKQQIEACYNIMAIPESATIELTGTKERKSRVEDWKSKRVFFVTPQVLQNDLLSVDELSSKIRCVIFDEAHKAKGNHAYCEVIRNLTIKNSLFRVLALSATPGNSVNDMKEVIQNLLISHLEFRTEESDDVKPYVFERKLETVVVSLDDKLHQVKENYLEVLERYTRCLVKYKIIQGNYSTLTKGKMFMVLKEFQEKNRNSRQPNSSEILKNLNICITLYHAYELLIRHGLRSFLSFFVDHIDKPLLRGNIDLIQIMEDVKSYLGTLTIAEPLPDGSYTAVADNIKCGHPKFYKLEEILVSHFTKHKENSRTIVFFEYRESVKVAYSLLLKNIPLIRPRIFLGQGSGVTQRVQMSVVQAFRDGQCNTLLSTCIGEEGLDVGEVDLIVCFDISSKSPIRMIQRMGRTGRKREGRVIILVTKGKEQQTLQDCLMKKKYLASNLSTLPELQAVLYTKSPRLIPDNISPKCEKIYITAKKIQSKATGKKNMNIKEMFRNISAPASSDYGEDSVFKQIVERIPQTVNFWNKSNPLFFKEDSIKTSFSKNLDVIRKLQPCNEINHSSDTNVLVALLQMAESKRYSIPVTQQCFSSHNTKALKQGDIRSIFKNTWALADIKPSQNCSDEIFLPVKTPVELSSQFDTSEEIVTEISDYLSIKESLETECCVCSKLFICPETPVFPAGVNLNDWVQPNLTKLCMLNKQDLKDLIPLVTRKRSANNGSILKNNNVGADLLNSVSLSDFESTFDNASKDNSYFGTADCMSKKYNKTFSHQVNYINERETNELLKFFKLRSLADLFVDEESNTTDVKVEMKIPLQAAGSPESPILCTYRNLQDLKSLATTKTNLYKSRFLDASSNQEKQPNKVPNNVALKLKNTNHLTFNKSSNFNSTSSSHHSKSSTSNEVSDFADIEDIFDLSVFDKDLVNVMHNKKEIKTGLSTENINNSREELNSSSENNIKRKDFELDDFDICDLSVFGLSAENTKKRKSSESDDQGNIFKKKKPDTPLYSMETKQLGIHTSLKNNDVTLESQVSVTQILSFVDKQHLQGSSVVKEDDPFKRLLDKL